MVGTGVLASCADMPKNEKETNFNNVSTELPMDAGKETAEQRKVMKDLQAQADMVVPTYNSKVLAECMTSAEVEQNPYVVPDCIKD